MTDPSNATGDLARAERAEADSRKSKERLLMFIVAFLGLLIIAGLGAVLFKIIYLSSTPSPQQASSRPPENVGSGGAERPASGRLEIPAGAVVKSLSLDGDRLAVHYEAPGGAGIAIFDLTTGAVQRLEVAPTP